MRTDHPADTRLPPALGPCVIITIHHLIINFYSLRLQCIKAIPVT